MNDFRTQMFERETNDQPDARVPSMYPTSIGGKPCFYCAQLHPDRICPRVTEIEFGEHGGVRKIVLKEED